MRSFDNRTLNLVKIKECFHGTLSRTQQGPGVESVAPESPICPMVYSVFLPLVNHRVETNPYINL